MGEPSFPKDGRPFSGMIGSGRPYVPSRRRRWADITSDEELSFSFMKSRAIANSKSLEHSCGKSASKFMGAGRSRCRNPAIPETSTATDLDAAPVLVHSERKPWRLPHYEECCQGTSSPNINGFVKPKTTEGTNSRDSSFLVRGSDAKGPFGLKTHSEACSQDPITSLTSPDAAFSNGTLAPSFVFSRFPKGFSSVMDVILSNTSQKSLNGSSTGIPTRDVSDSSVASGDLNELSGRTSGIPSLTTPYSENFTAAGCKQASQPKITQERVPMKTEMFSEPILHHTVKDVIPVAIEATDSIDACSNGCASSGTSTIHPYTKLTPLELLSVAHYLALSSKNPVRSEPPFPPKKFGFSSHATNEQTGCSIMGSWSELNRQETSSYYASRRRATPEQQDADQECWRQEASYSIGSSKGLSKRLVPTVRLQRDKPRENDNCNNENEYPLFIQKNIQDDTSADTTRDVFIKDKSTLETLIKDKSVSPSVEVVTSSHPDSDEKPDLPRSNHLKREKNPALTIPPTTFVSILNLNKVTDTKLEDNEYPEMGKAALTLPVVSPGHVKKSSTRASPGTVISKRVDSKFQRPVADALPSQQLKQLGPLLDNDKSCVPQKSQKRQAKTSSKNRFKGTRLAKPQASVSLPTVTTAKPPVQNSVRMYRLRQLAIEKSSPEYLRYIRLVDKTERTAEQPQTPRVDVPVSCGDFYAQLHEWRYQVRRWCEEQSSPYVSGASV